MVKKTATGQPSTDEDELSQLADDYPLPKLDVYKRQVIDLLEHIGAEKGATPAQIALAWLLAQKPWIVPIPRSRRIERLEENIGAVAVELTSDDLRAIENAMSKITVVGDRY